MTGSSNASYRKMIVGLQGSGKTELAKKMIKETTSKGGKALIVDILAEYIHNKKLGNIDVYVPTNSVYPVVEVDTLINNYILTPYFETGKQPYNLIVFDEASRYFQNKNPLPQSMGYINDMARHLKLDVIVIARRFTQVNTDLVELSHKLYIFNQTGINDIKRLNELSIGLGDTILNIPKYYYVEVDQWRKYIIKNPIKIV